MLKVRIRSFTPPAGTMMFSTGTSTSSRYTSALWKPRTPMKFSGLPNESPGVPFSR